AVFAVPAYGPQNDVTLKMPAFEWVHVQLHQQKGMISLSPPTICNSAVFESHASDIYLIVEEGFYKRTLDIHRTLGLLLHTQVSIQQLLKLPAECFHPKPRVNSVLIKLTRHTTDVPDKYWKLYTYFVSKWVNREYRQLFTKNQFHQAMKHAKVNNLSTVTYEQVLSIFNSYLLFNGRK
ncbi:rRNA adenine N-6-methyltransferase family protein, partial [Salmonella enterica]|uniref:rRNA adenine N-6-methyltransferase family protein n=1 Tax=Salmonella enterica TaxID=28901 RepID=UPI002AFE56EE